MTAIRESMIGTCFGARAVVAVAWVYGALFGANEEEGWVGLGECHSCGCEIFCFGWRWCSELKVFLRLREHVDSPAADNAVGRGGDDVMSILSTDDGDVVNRVGVTGTG